LMIGAAAALLGLWIAFHLTRRLLCRYGERWQIAGEDDWSTLVVLMLVFTVLTIVSAPIANAVTRYVEHRADVYGQEVIHAFGVRQTSTDDNVSKRITLKKGMNVLRFAVIQGDGPADCCARFIDARQKPITGLTVMLVPPAEK